MSETVTRRLFWLIAGMTLVRGLFAAATPLIHDEAYYWLWSRRLDWSYLDHPPMIAYLIRLATLGGDGELWVRLPALLLGPVIAYALFLLGRDLFDERVGFLAVVLYQVAPVLGASGMFSTPDAPMYLAWAVAMRFFWQAMHGRPERWPAAGLALGLGLLSKLYTVFLGIGAAIYITLYARPWLRRPEAYLAAAVALLLLAPVMYWNVTHEWATLRFLLYERKEIGSAPGLGAIKLLLTQHLPLVLVLFPAFAWAVWAAWRRRSDERFGFLFWTSVPAVAIAFLVAPLGAARGHWMGPAYISLAVVLAALWTRPVTWLAAGNAVLQGVFLALVLIPALPGFPGAREYYGWREAGARVLEEVAALAPDRPVIVADRYQVSAQLGYHTRDTIPVLLLPRPDPASIWPSLERFAGATAVVVTYAPERFQWEGCFDRVEERPPIPVQLRGRVIQEFRVFRLYGLSPSCGSR